MGSRRSLGLAVVAGLLLAAPAARGDEPPPTPERTGWVAPVLGTRFGTPLRISASAGLILGRVSADDAAYHTASGWLVQAEAGAGGGKLALGKAAALLYGPFRPYAGGALKAVVVRTWGSPLGARPRRTYAGAEVDLALLYVRASVGLLRQVAGSGDDTMLSWGVGIGF
jgi:hypothetical protein